MLKTIDFERSTLVCTKCGLCEDYPAYVASYNHLCNIQEGNAYTRDPIILKSYKISSFMVERRLFQISWKQLEMKYMIKLTYCIPMKYL